MTRKAIEIALAGDTVALRMCMDRIAPPRKDRTVAFPLPAIEKASDALKATATIIAGVARGELTPLEAAALTGLVDCFTRALEASDFDTRLKALEHRKGYHA